MASGKGYGTYIRSLSNFKSEDEFLLQRGSKLFVKSIEVAENGKKFVEMLLINNEWR